MNINKNVQGHLFALTANVMWGLMAPIGKFALQEFSALSVTAEPHFPVRTEGNTTHCFALTVYTVQ